LVIGLACVVVGIEMADIIQFLEALLFVALAAEPCRERPHPECRKIGTPQVGRLSGIGRAAAAFAKKGRRRVLDPV